MDSILFTNFQTVVPRSGVISAIDNRSLPCALELHTRPLSTADTANSVPLLDRTYSVGDFMARKERLHAVKPTTTVEEALETLCPEKNYGVSVIDDNWKLVGVVSDYDLLSPDSISGGDQHDTNMIPDVDSSWKHRSYSIKLMGRLLATL